MSKNEKFNKISRRIEAWMESTLFGRHLRRFWVPWVLFMLMLVVTFSFKAVENVHLLMALICLFVFALWIKPMNIIHGLIGTRGEIKTFIFVFLILNMVFSAIYYGFFFKNAGITYDTSQPHVEFNMFDTIKGESVCVLKGCGKEMVPDNCYGQDTCHYYHKIGYEWVLQNTFLTSLMQEPTEFYSFTCTYNGNYDKNDTNKIMVKGFNWFLVFHITISWILLGVFISLIYQKFRNS